MKLKNFKKVFQIIKIVKFEIHSKKRRKLKFPSCGNAHWLGQKRSIGRKCQVR